MLWFSLCGLEENWYLCEANPFKNIFLASVYPKKPKSHKRNFLHGAVMGSGTICLKPARLSAKLQLQLTRQGKSASWEDMAPLWAVGFFLFPSAKSLTYFQYLVWRKKKKTKKNTLILRSSLSLKQYYWCLRLCPGCSNLMLSVCVEAKGLSELSPCFWVPSMLWNHGWHLHQCSGHGCVGQPGWWPCQQGHMSGCGPCQAVVSPWPCHPPGLLAQPPAPAWDQPHHRKWWLGRRAFIKQVVCAWRNESHIVFSLSCCVAIFFILSLIVSPLQSGQPIISWLPATSGAL